MQFTLENELTGITLSGKPLAITGLVNKLTGDKYIKYTTDAPLCQIVCMKAGDTERLLFIPAGEPGVENHKEADYQELKLSFGGISNQVETLNIRIEIVIRLENVTGESHWQINIANQAEGVDVVEVLFPYLRGVALGESWEDDVIIYPHHAGEKTVAPAREYTSERFQSFSRAQTQKDGDIWQREINYCGLASMTWMYYYDPEQGLYFASHDDDFPVTGLRVETGGPANPWMGFAFRKYHRIRPGQEWQSKPYVIALTDQDWHWGARRYRTWILPKMEILPNPPDLADEFSLTKCYSLKREGRVIHHYRDLPDIFSKGKSAFRSRHMFIASWNRGGFDTDYPEYQPDMDLGSPMELYNACQEIIRNDGHITFYINARIFDLGSKYFKTLGKCWAIKDHAGKMKEEHYDWQSNFAVSCPAERSWQEYLMDIACWMVQSYHARGIYLDQLGSAEPIPCYDSVHTHQDIGDFNHGYLTILRELRPRLQQLNPDTYLMIENCGDIYSPYVWTNLVWNGEPYDEFFNLYRYTFPEFGIVHMVNPITNLQGEARRERFYQDMERATLLGAVFWLGLDKFGDEDQHLWEYMTQTVDFRARLQPFIKDGKYLDTEGILSTSSDIRVSHWQLTGDRHLYVIGNRRQLADQTIKINLPDKVEYQLSTENIDRSVEPLTAERGNHSLTIKVPAHTLSYVLVDFN